MTETIEHAINEKLDVDDLKLEVLSVIAEITRRIMLDNRYGAIMTDEKNRWVLCCQVGRTFTQISGRH